MRVTYKALRCNSSVRIRRFHHDPHDNINETSNATPNQSSVWCFRP